MSWRDRIAKIIASGGRSDLPPPAYHATKENFSAFRHTPDTYTTVDRSLGPHFAKDPALSNSFVMKYLNGPTNEAVEGGRVIPAVIPHESKFLDVPQPRYQWATADTPAWKAAQTDQRAIEIAASKLAYQRDPALLGRYLAESRRLPPDEAARLGAEMSQGKTVRIQDRDYDLDSFLNNFGGQPYNDADRKALVDAARSAWQDQGYAGLRYINTSPQEMAFGAKDPTSYVVFDPKNVRSRFAKFDPANVSSGDLLGSVAALSTVPIGIGAFTAQDSYEVPR